MTPSNFFKNLYNKIPENVKKAFIYSLLFGIICHFYMLTNKLTNHDDIHQLFNIMDLKISGRWFLQYANRISSYLSMPWVNGLLVILYLSISNSIIVSLFKIKNTLSIVILSGILMTFPAVVAIMPYMQSADAYFLACLLSVIGTYIFIKSKYKFVFILLNILSLATYQIFFGYSVSLVLAYYLVELLFGNLKFKEVLKKVSLLAIYTIITLALYVITVKYIFTTDLTSYQGLDKIGIIDFRRLPKLILRTYTQIIKFFLFDHFSQFGFVKYLNYILFTVAIFGFIYSIYNAKKELKEKILIVLIAMALPLFINLMCILAPDAVFGLRMRYASVLVYLLIILLIERFLENNDFCLEDKSSQEKLSIKNSGENLRFMVNWSIFIILSLSIFKFIIVSNQVYMSLDIDSRNLAAYTNRVLSSIEEKDYYTRRKEVVFIGSPDIRTNFTKLYYDRTVKSSILLEAKIPRNPHWALYPERYSAFPNKIRYTYINNLDKRIKEDAELMNKLKQSPIYPQRDSIFEYNGKIYVKFQEIK